MLDVFATLVKESIVHVTHLSYNFMWRIGKYHRGRRVDESELVSRQNRQKTSAQIQNIMLQHKVPF